MMTFVVVMLTCYHIFSWKLHPLQEIIETRKIKTWSRAGKLSLVRLGGQKRSLVLDAIFLFKRKKFKLLQSWFAENDGSTALQKTADLLPDDLFENESVYCCLLSLLFCHCVNTSSNEKQLKGRCQEISQSSFFSIKTSVLGPWLRGLLNV
jgi:hypothetical protein